MLLTYASSGLKKASLHIPSDVVIVLKRGSLTFAPPCRYNMLLLHGSLAYGKQRLAGLLPLSSLTPLSCFHIYIKKLTFLAFTELLHAHLQWVLRRAAVHRGGVLPHLWGGGVLQGGSLISLDLNCHVVFCHIFDHYTL